MNVLDDILSQPHVLGNSSLLLTERLEGLSPEEKVAVIQAAQQSGLLEPLVSALQTQQDDFIQGAAASALTWLKPGPKIETLLELLAIPNWLVRWQILDILRQKASEQNEDFLLHRPQIQAVLHNLLTKPETDPEVLATIAHLLKNIGEQKNTPWVVPLLDDPDPEVRLAAVDALANFGDLRALPSLYQVEDGKGFWGKNVSKKAHEAIKAIKQRYPPEIQNIRFGKQVTTDKLVETPMSLFLSRVPTIYCVVTIANLQPYDRVVIQWKHEVQIITSQEQVVTQTTLDSTITMSSEKSPEYDWDDDELVRILIGETDTTKVYDKEKQVVVPLVFSLSLLHSTDNWQVGDYIVEVLIDNEWRGEGEFTIVDQVPVIGMHPCIAVDNDTDWQYRNRFLVDNDISCCVELQDAPVGLEVLGKIHHGSHGSLLASTTIQTSEEGDQTLVISWQRDNWPPGKHLMAITTETKNKGHCEFQVIPKVEIPYFLPSQSEQTKNIPNDSLVEITSVIPRKTKNDDKPSLLKNWGIAVKGRMMNILVLDSGFSTLFENLFIIPLTFLLKYFIYFFILFVFLGLILLGPAILIWMPVQNSQKNEPAFSESTEQTQSKNKETEIPYDP